MAVLGTKFNAQDHDTTQTDYSELPNGIYKIEVEASEIKNNNGNVLLKVTNNVIEPEAYMGRKLFNNYNLEHKSAQAQEIGQKQFASLCRAIGIAEVEDSEDLHFRAYIVRVGLGKPSKDGQYPARAEIKRYFFPDEGDVPEPEVSADQPKVARVTAPANDNRRTAANDNRLATTTAAAKPAGNKPWSVKK